MNKPIDYRRAGIPPRVPPPERQILLDLIAELVGDDGDGHELTGDDDHGCQVCAAIDRAETRLREATKYAHQMQDCLAEASKDMT